jgi:hypothetical protein
VALVVLIVGVAVFVPQPTTFQHSVFRAVLALGIACVAATVPGFSGMSSDGGPGLAGISGGLGAFLVVYLIDPMRRFGQRDAVAAAALPAVPLAAMKPEDRSIFICYRRNDSEETVGRLYQNLVERLGEQSVFKDVNAILAGLDYRKELAAALQRCRIVLAVIGPDWEKDAKGNRTIDQARDYVNIELSSALKRGVPLIPILVERRPALPAQGELPPELSDLVYRQCLHLRPDPDFENDFERLMENIQALLARSEESASVR